LFVSSIGVAVVIKVLFKKDCGEPWMRLPYLGVRFPFPEPRAPHVMRKRLQIQVH